MLVPRLLGAKFASLQDAEVTGTGCDHFVLRTIFSFALKVLSRHGVSTERMLTFTQISSNVVIIMGPIRVNYDFIIPIFHIILSLKQIVETNLFASRTTA